MIRAWPKRSRSSNRMRNCRRGSRRNKRRTKSSRPNSRPHRCRKICSRRFARERWRASRANQNALRSRWRWRRVSHCWDCSLRCGSTALRPTRRDRSPHIGRTWRNFSASFRSWTSRRIGCRKCGNGCPSNTHSPPPSCPKHWSTFPASAVARWNGRAKNSRSFVSWWKARWCICS